jgi:opacity protein-like surface antigen
MTCGLTIARLGAAALLALSVAPACAQVRQSPTPIEVKFSGWCGSVSGGQRSSSQGGSDFRVRGGGDLTASGFRQTVVVEPGGKASITGRNITVYAMDGASVTVMGEKNEIYLEPRALVSVVGSHGMTRVPKILISPARSDSECD